MKHWFKIVLKLSKTIKNQKGKSQVATKDMSLSGEEKQKIDINYTTEIAQK